jgi:hypothetical protein
MISKVNSLFLGQISTISSMEVNPNDQSDSDCGNTGEDIKLPQKKFYRQRAHSNPLNDHSFV